MQHLLLKMESLILARSEISLTTVRRAQQDDAGIGKGV